MNDLTEYGKIFRAPLQRGEEGPRPSLSVPVQIGNSSQLNVGCNLCSKLQPAKAVDGWLPDLVHSLRRDYKFDIFGVV